MVRWLACWISGFVLGVSRAPKGAYYHHEAILLTSKLMPASFTPRHDIKWAYNCTATVVFARKI